MMQRQRMRIRGLSSHSNHLLLRKFKSTSVDCAALSLGRLKWKSFHNEELSFRKKMSFSWGFIHASPQGQVETIRSRKRMTTNKPQTPTAFFFV